MADFNYLGFHVIDGWPTASRIKGACKPSTERYYTFYGEDRLVWAHTQREMRMLLGALNKEVK